MDAADSDQREHDANASAVSANDMQSPEIGAASHDNGIVLYYTNHLYNYSLLFLYQINFLWFADQFRTPNGSARNSLGKQIADGKEAAEKGELDNTHTASGSRGGQDDDEGNPKAAVAVSTKKSVNFSMDIVEGRGSSKAASTLTLDEILGSTYTDDNEGGDNEYDLDESELMGEEEAEEDEDLSRKHWNLAKYLPSAAEEYFYYIIGQYNTNTA